jgi:hypothetical protein
VNPGFSVKYEGRAGGDALGRSVGSAPPTAHAFEVNKKVNKMNSQFFFDFFFMLNPHYIR